VSAAIGRPPAGAVKGIIVSNPVVPPPASEGTFPPAAEQAAAALAGPPGQVAPGSPPPEGTPGPDGAAAAPPPVKRRSPVGKLLLRVGLALAVGIAGVAVKNTLFGDKAKDAAVGNCIAASGNVTSATAETETDAKVVDCGAADAAFTVVGRVDGQTDVNSTACDTYFTDGEEFAVYASTAGGGYLLCLKPKA
jgi:hypothetical protein